MLGTETWKWHAVLTGSGSRGHLQLVSGPSSRPATSPFAAAARAGSSTLSPSGLFC